MKKPIRSILFDFGNVLGYFLHDEACRRLAAALNSSGNEVTAKSLRQELLSGEELSLRQTGDLSGWDFYHMLVSDYGLDKNRYSYGWLRVCWGNIFTPAPNSLVSLLKSIKPEVPAHLVSNTEEMHWPFVLGLRSVQCLIYRTGGDLFASFELGYEKPDERFFEAVIESTGIEVESTLFIDDSHNNIRTFKELGGQAERFHLNSDRLADLKQILRSHNLLAY